MATWFVTLTCARLLMVVNIQVQHSVTRRDERFAASNVLKSMGQNVIREVVGVHVQVELDLISAKAVRVRLDLNRQLSVTLQGIKFVLLMENTHLNVPLQNVMKRSRIRAHAYDGLSHFF